jgi:hypothetical protein
MARGGKLEIVMDSARLVDGERGALRATKEVTGGGHTGAMTAGIVVTGLLFWPAATFFLFMHGKDISIPNGAQGVVEYNLHTRGAFPKGLIWAQSTPNQQQTRKLQALLLGYTHSVERMSACGRALTSNSHWSYVGFNRPFEATGPARGSPLTGYHF